MANRYWVGGTATWDATAGSKWSTTSGGGGGSAVPTAADDVFFDAASGAVTITTSGTTTDVCRSLNCTGFTGTLSHATTTTITIGDGTAGAGNIALKLVAGMTYTPGSNTTSILSFVSTSATVQTIDFGGKSTSATTYNGVGGSWQIISDQTAIGSTTPTTLTNGTLDITNRTITSGTFISSGTGTRNFIATSSVINIIASTGTIWSIGSTNLSMTLTGSTLNFTDNGASNKSISLSFNFIYPTVNITGGGAGIIIFNGGTAAPRITSLTVGAPKTLQFLSGSSFIFTNLTLNSSVGNVITLQSSTAGTPTTFNSPSSMVSADYLSVKDITATGGAAFFAGSNSTDVSGNTGWNFRAPSPQGGNFFQVM